MIVIKAGGSVFAPKNDTSFNEKYLKDLYEFFSSLDETVCFVHGTGNIGHGFVSKYGVSQCTLPIWRERSKIFFQKMDYIFEGFTRCGIEDVLSGKIDNEIYKHNNIIIGGDISEYGLKILSSDDVLGYMLKSNIIDVGYCLTDIDGVLDIDNKVISEINLSAKNNINFWRKLGDNSGGMEGKIKMLKKYVTKDKQSLWIVNGWKLDRIKELLKTGETKGTKIYKLDLK